MAKIKYEEIALRKKAVATILQANSIIEEYARQGYSLTLRQLYYQFVARGLIPNTNREYQRLSVVISNGRRAGLIDWSAIVDRTRFLRSTNSWESPVDILESCAAQFRFDPWVNQKCYIEIWFEKDALLGVFERASQLRRLPLMSCRGYGSDSTWWEAAQRLKEYDRWSVPHGKNSCIILHFGDHDPSGLDMTRDIEERLNLFGAFPAVKRLALNMDQVRKYNPPPNPAKETDSRFADYQAEYGDESWELDALNPDVLVKLVHKEVEKHLDVKQWARDMKREEEAKKELGLLSTHYKEVVAHAKDLA